MDLFDPHTFDAGIHDVVSNLNDSQKVDVLLHALQHLPIQGYVMDSVLSPSSLAHVRKMRTIMENAVQSLLRVPDLSPANGARALLLRTKYRLAAGYLRPAR